jgi:cation/acetate symporter
VGLIASRLTGVQFEIGIMLGLGGVLLCSFLGGMRAITWTQVAQYVVMFLTFLIPVSWLAYKQMGNPLAPLVYGQQLAKIATLEDQLINSPQEKEVQAIYRQRAQALQRKLDNAEVALAQERQTLQERLRALRQSDADVAQIVELSRELASLPKDPASAREQWRKTMQEDEERAQPLGGMPRHTQAFRGDPDGTDAEKNLYSQSRLNFLALMFCLMVGTAGLPHLLTRYYTSPSVADTRRSVVWSLVFIAVVYLSAPALAVLVKYEVMNNLVGSRFDQLPVWILQWAKVDPSLVSVSDVNGDGILQFGEIKLGADLIMLATPELGGLPYVVSALVAAGGLAAALSTADGLLLTISNSLVRDLHFFKHLRQAQSPEQRVIASKFVLMAVALLAAFVAALKPSQILPLVTASFSLAASALVPAMVLGIFWRGTHRAGAVAGMLTGLGVTLYYLLINAVGGFTAFEHRWWGIEPVCAGVFGVPAGLLATVLVSVWAGRFKESPAIPLQT